MTSIQVVCLLFLAFSRLGFGDDFFDSDANSSFNLSSGLSFFRQPFGHVLEPRQACSVNCVDNKVCCDPAGTTCCNGGAGTYCNPPTVCCDGRYCNPEGSTCCNGGNGIYCNPPNVCCDGHFCNPAGSTCCNGGSGIYCIPPNVCCDGHFCNPAGSTCCG